MMGCTLMGANLIAMMASFPAVRSDAALGRGGRAVELLHRPPPRDRGQPGPLEYPRKHTLTKVDTTARSTRSPRPTGVRASTSRTSSQRGIVGEFAGATRTWKLNTFGLSWKRVRYVAETFTEIAERYRIPITPRRRHDRERTDWRSHPRPSCRADARSDDRLPGGADLPDDQLRLPRRRARGEPLRAEGVRQHLHPADEPDDRRLREADGRARGRHGGRRGRVGAWRPSRSPLLTVTELGDEIVSGDNLYGGTYNLFAVTLPAARPDRQVRRLDRPRGLPRGDHGEDAGDLRRVDRQPEARRARLRGHRAIAHEAGIPLVVDNTDRGRARPPDRARRGHRGLLGHEVHRRARHLDRRRHRRRRQLRLGQRQVPRSSPSPTRATTGSSTGTRSATSPASGTSRSRSGSGSSSSATRGRRCRPFNAFLFLQGLETLPLRVRRHSENALTVAQFLDGAPEGRLGQLPGPPGQPEPRPGREVPSGGFGALVGFGVKGGGGGQRGSSTVKLFATSPTSGTRRAW